MLPPVALLSYQLLEEIQKKWRYIIPRNLQLLMIIIGGGIIILSSQIRHPDVHPILNGQHIPLASYILLTVACGLIGCALFSEEKVKGLINGIVIATLIIFVYHTEFISDRIIAQRSPYFAAQKALQILETNQAQEIY